MSTVEADTPDAEDTSHATDNTRHHDQGLSDNGPAAVRVHRVEVHGRADQPNPVADAVCRDAKADLGNVTSVRYARIFLVEAPLPSAQVDRLAQQLLADPVTQTAAICHPDRASGLQPSEAVIEIHYKPGVMDPVAQSTREAMAEMFGDLDPQMVEVRTGFRYVFAWAEADQPPAEALRWFAEAHLANPVVQDIYDHSYHPTRFSHGLPYQLRLVHVPILDLDDERLMRLSRDGHLFLNLEEMRAIQAYYRQLPGGGREPSDIELETLAQTWSEHCVHKTLKATVHYQQQDPTLTPSPADWADRAGHTKHADGSLTIDNLLKSTIAAATRQLMREDPFREWCISVFEDNAGVVRFDEDQAVCIKVETHNHPSAIEPYGGAATGIGGCIRDIMGTGLCAKPIANTDVFCVAPPGLASSTKGIPKGVIPPQRVLQQVVAGVRDYGNRMGIPTVNGAVWFHDDYVANPLVFAGCVGVMPADKCFGDPQKGDRIIALGGHTGRDGIHGATFSSAELTDSHADEFSHAVQIGNAITQKKVLDVLLQARDHDQGCLFNAITDCGAGGFSSAVGEMAQELGARVTLEAAPLKYAGLSYTEIWISEAQERMVLAVPPDKVVQLTDLCESEDVSWCDLGQFGEADDAGEPQLTLSYQGIEVGRLSCRFLHHGLPTPTRSAVYPSMRGSTSSPTSVTSSSRASQPDLSDLLYRLLAHPNVASKQWIVRQYDHEVQGGSVIKPLVGPGQDGPGDAAVLRPILTSLRGVAIGCGLQPGLGEKAVGGQGDSYWMALAAMDEAIRNVVCVGADPDRVAILDNFCWPGCDDPANLGALVRACQGCYDGALAYRTPFVSGKDSLNNQFTTEQGELITIPPTLLITALGIVPDVARCVSMDAKAAGHLLVVVGQKTGGAMGGSHFLMTVADESRDHQIPRVDLTTAPVAARAVASLIDQGRVRSAHDCSDGGFLVAAAEMAFAGRVGLDIDLAGVPAEPGYDDTTIAFSETPGRYLLEVAPDQWPSVKDALDRSGVAFGQVGIFTAHDRLTVWDQAKNQRVDESLDALRSAWLGSTSDP